MIERQQVQSVFCFLFFFFFVCVRVCVSSSKHENALKKVSTSAQNLPALEKWRKTANRMSRKMQLTKRAEPSTAVEIRYSGTSL